MSELRLGQDKAYLNRKAADEGLIVFLPEPNEVFLDMDDPLKKINHEVLNYIFEPLDKSEFEMQASSIGIGLISMLQTRSKSGNFHLYLRASRALSQIERVIFQVCLGSDPIKELFSFIQLRYVDLPNLPVCECPVALFETPAEAVKVQEWRAR